MKWTKEYNKKYCKEWHKKNKEKTKNYRKQYYLKNKEKVRNYGKIWREKNKEKVKEWSKKYIKIKRNQNRKQRRKIDLKFRLDNNMGSIISICLKGKKEGKRWQKLVEYTIEDLIEHLEKQFDNKMTWENYGSYWWIDHIKPKSSFKYQTPEDPEFKQCWALENLQPLEKITNIKKSNFYKGR